MIDFIIGMVIIFSLRLMVGTHGVCEEQPSTWSAPHPWLVINVYTRAGHLSYFRLSITLLILSAISMEKNPSFLHTLNIHLLSVRTAIPCIPASFTDLLAMVWYNGGIPMETSQLLPVWPLSSPLGIKSRMRGTQDSSRWGAAVTEQYRLYPPL